MTPAAGSLSLAEVNLRNSLANSPAFIAFCGVVDAAAADARIYHDFLPTPADGEIYTLNEHLALRPCAIIGTNTDDGFSGFGVEKDAQFGWKAMGILQIWILWTIPDTIASDEPELSRQIKNYLGTILEDIRDAADSADRLNFNKAMVGEVYRNPQDTRPTEGDFMTGTIQVEWEGV